MQSQIGVIGLAVMGENLILNMATKGFTVSAFNRTTSKVDEFIAGRAAGKSIVGAQSLPEFVGQLERPRKVMLMELLGPRWADIDMISSLLSVTQAAVVVNGDMVLGTPKSNASRRKISISPDTVAILEQHREPQAKERHNAQEGWSNMDLVFASEVDTVTNDANLRTVLKQLQARVIVQASLEPHDRHCSAVAADLKKKMVVSDLNLHGLRHIHASVLIRHNISPKVVSDRLGHTSIGFTLKTYAYLFNDQKREAAIGIEAFLGTVPSSVPGVVSSSVPTALN
jgi:integrase